MNIGKWKGNYFVFGILFSWQQLLHCLEFESNIEGEIINILFQKLHYPLEQEYGLKKIS